MSGWGLYQSNLSCQLYPQSHGLDSSHRRQLRRQNYSPGPSPQNSCPGPPPYNHDNQTHPTYWDHLYASFCKSTFPVSIRFQADYITQFHSGHPAITRQTVTEDRTNKLPSTFISVRCK